MMLQLSTKLVINKDLIQSPNLCDRFSRDDLLVIGKLTYEGYQADDQSRSPWKRRMSAAMDLAMHDERVDDGADIVDRAIAHELGDAGLGIDFDLADMRTRRPRARGDDLIADAEARRLYVTRQTHVMVLDADTGKVVGDIPDTEGVHGVALVPELNKGFISNGKDNTVTIFDIKTMEKTGSVTAGQKPDAIFYEPFSKRVFTSDNGGLVLNHVTSNAPLRAGKGRDASGV
jgi:hypothetical protein